MAEQGEVDVKQQYGPVSDLSPVEVLEPVNPRS